MKFRKIIISLVFAVITTFTAAALGIETETYKLIPTEPGCFLLEFKTEAALDAFKTGHADYIEVRYIDEQTMTAEVFIDEYYAVCLGADSE